jgi:hypothetical protein
MSIAFNPFSGQLTTQPDLLRLPNNARIGNTEHFYQTTKPTARGNGSALVVGDRWWKIDDGTEWYWNGTYWLSERFVYSNLTSTSIFNFATTQSYPLSFSIFSYFPNNQLFIESATIAWSITSGSCDSTNKWTINGYFNNAVEGAGLGQFLIAEITSNSGKITSTINTAYVAPSATDIQYLRVTNVKSGTAGTLLLPTLSLNIRAIFP